MKSPDIQYSCSDKCCMIFTAVVLFNEEDFIPLSTQLWKRLRLQKNSVEEGVICKLIPKSKSKSYCKTVAL